jgi:ubiquinol-cytochrome c reductase cytochrome b subunit
MRLLKSHPILRLGNGYLVDSPQPINLSYLWNFGSLLAFCLIIQIITGVTLAMHYNPSVLEAFNSVEHIMRDVNNGWLIRYLHSNTASAFFFLVYLHIGRGMYYGSYRAPRTLVWTIGTVIFILMMATKKVLWPNWLVASQVKDYNIHTTVLLFNKGRTRAIRRIGPHNIDVLSIIICGMLGDWWANKIKGKQMDSVRFCIEQGVKNSAYIHHLNITLHDLGYCSNVTPKLVVKSEPAVDKREDPTVTRYNYRLITHSFTSLLWIYNSFYHEVDGIMIKKIPYWIGEFITPIGLAHWIMQDGSRQKNQGISLATNSFTYKDCVLLSKVLNEKYGLKTSVVKTGHIDQWKISIWKQSMPDLVSTVKPYIVNEMKYKFIGYL